MVKRNTTCAGTTEKTILDEAAQLVDNLREEDYGPPVIHFTKVGRLWAPVLGLEQVTPEQVALCMIQVKVSRLCQTPNHHDSQVDIAGYARVYERIREAEEENNG